MNSLEAELSAYGFLRPHASFLVNFRYIAQIGDDLILKDSTKIPISRNRRKELLNKITQYAGDIL